MVFTDSKSKATLTLFITGYEYYPDTGRQDADWLCMGFCYHDARNHRYKLAEDACISISCGDDLRRFAALFRSALSGLEEGQQVFYCPMEQMPKITITKTSAFAWQVEVLAILPNITLTPEATYTIVNTHVTAWELQQYADAFTDFAIEWPGGGKHCLPPKPRRA